MEVLISIRLFDRSLFLILVLIADFGGVFDMVGTALIWIATALTVISLVDYVWANREVLTKGGM